ncbi:hypothetical protein FQN57_004013 [Myotisia sp. PD_48]|nr:hypothetical protein FQN57_004013 [Myotisia sp. PD_48]
MRVAIAGAGSLAKYLSEELPKVGHEVVILTRSAKPFFDGKEGVISPQRITDYSDPTALAEQLSDCDALISTILDYTMDYTRAHLALIEACKRSPKCKRFIPSEFGGNLEDFPDQPMFYTPNHGPVRKCLREQSEIEWTLVCVGWFSDYLLPGSNRYFSDVEAGGYPIDLTNHIAVLPGTGKELLAMTSARDAARAIGYLLNAPRWNPYVYIQGEATTWRRVAELVKEGIPDLKVQFLSLTEMINIIAENKSESEVIGAGYNVFSASGAGSFDVAKVEADRDLFFKGMKFRSCRELLEDAERNPDSVI